MKAMLFILFALVLTTSIMFAGTPMTSQGDKALTFTINGLGNFGVSGVPAVSAPGLGTLYGAGGKYFVSQDMAFRTIVAFNNYSTTVKTGSGDDKNSTTWIGIAPGLEWHMAAAGAVSPYWGLMADFGWAKNTHTPPTGSETSSSGTSFGAAALLGAEWYAFDGVSFNAEYQFGFSTTSTKTNPGTGDVDGPSYTTFGINSWAVGINVYLGH
ncbi:MAG: hypothetical protein HY033_13810 [Ignavibacteriae bacterium]|nr:hypothetical protein [Ignavibacteria bacterium]MBI3365965.1 hypothetical protein [Ignavibacteriota bacterium]